MYSIVPPELVWGIALGLIRKFVDGDRVSTQILESLFALTVETVNPPNPPPPPSPYLLFYFALYILLDVAALQFVGRSISVF